MKTLVFIGSPRKNGVSGVLLNRLGLKGYWVYELNIRPCIACDYCQHKPLCFIEDDMIRLYKEITDADIIGIITPIYFMGLPSPLKSIVDRLQVFYNNPLSSKKYGFVFMIGEQINKSFKEYYRKMWYYIFKNIGIQIFDFFLLGNIKTFSDIDIYNDNIVLVKNRLESLYENI